MLKKAIFAAALALGFVTSFHFARGQALPDRVEVKKAAACGDCQPGEGMSCCDVDMSCC
jgi:hypothetical protein